MLIQERRIDNRFPLVTSGCAIINGGNVDMKTHDVSQGGALVEFVDQPCLEIGMRLRVYLEIGFVGRVVVCRMNTRDNRTLYGLKFDRFDFYSDLLLSAYFVKYGQQLSKNVTLH